MLLLQYTILLATQESENMTFIINLNNMAASLMISNPERCGNPISHLHKALVLLNMSQFPHNSSQASIRRQVETDSSDGELPFLSNIQEGTETSTNNPSFDEGMDIFAKPLFLQSSCNHNKNTLESTILFNLGLAHCSIQEFEEGILYLEKSLSVTRKVPSMISPSEVPSQHDILHNIGRVYFLAGNYSEAIKAYSRTFAEQGVTQDLKAEEKTFFDVVPFRTAATLNCIAVCRLHRHADVVTYPLDKTLLLLHRALCILDKVLLCCADINTSRSVALEKAITVNNIGRALYQLGDFSGALSAYTEAYVLRKDLLGNDHLDVAVSVYNMAEAQCCLGNDTDAIKGYATYISIVAEKLGSNHPAIASVLTTMGQLYYKLNDCYLAIKYLSLALKSSLHANDPQDEEVAVIHNLIGTASFEVGEVDAALVAFLKGLQIERKIGVSEDEIVTTLCNIGNALRFQKNFDEALGYYQEARDGIERTKGACDELASVKTMVAFVKKKQELYFDAEQELKAVLELNKSLHGALSLQASSTWNSLGLLYHDWGSYQQSLECFSECLRIHVQSSFELGTSEILALHNNIAITHCVLGELDQALRFYNEMHHLEEEEIYASSVSTDDNISDLAKSALSTLQSIARVYQKKGKTGIELQYLRKASAFFLEHEELMCDEDRYSLYSSLEMYYSDFRMLQDKGHSITSKPGAPAA